MNAIGRLLGIPAGGWSHGQSRLFERGDVRVVALLRRFSNKSAARRVAQNLARVGTLSGAELMLTVVTASREHSSALTDVSSRTIDSFREGGLDFLGDEMKRLGLPRSVTRDWLALRPRFNRETGNAVHPARIPARDQTLVYAAQIRANYQHYFLKHATAQLGSAATSVISRTSRVAMLVWKAYAFLAPGGAAYDPHRSVAGQSGQRFGCRSALQYVAAAATSGGRPVQDLNGIVTLPDLNSVEWVRSSKIRAAEGLYLERLLTVVRELLPLGGRH